LDLHTKFFRVPSKVVTVEGGKDGSDMSSKNNGTYICRGEEQGRVNPSLRAAHLLE
jgi:hypothetical protein